LIIGIVFKFFVGRKRIPLSRPINLDTVTQDELKNELFADYNFGMEFNIEDASLEFVIYDTKEKFIPMNDITFREMLRTMAGKNMFRLSVQVSTPSKAYSSYNLNTMCQLYGLSDGTGSSLDAFPKLDCGSISGDAFERELEKLMVTLNEYLLITPFDAMNEATKSIYVYVFIHRAISIFGNNAFRIFPEKEIRGTHGRGYVDFAIDSRQTSRTVGVTEVKHDDFKQGVAQNAVQLDSCLVSIFFLFFFFIIPSHHMVQSLNEFFFFFSRQVANARPVKSRAMRHLSAKHLVSYQMQRSFIF
jgi:hypothetical protein